MRQEFLTELEELVEKFCAAIEELRAGQASARIRRDTLAQIFRCVHSIKGISAAAGLDMISELVHETETLLDRARSGRVSINDPLVNALEEAADAISDGLSAAVAAEPAPLFQALLNRLRALSNAAPDLPLGAAPRVVSDLPADIAASLDEREKQLLLEALREGGSLYAVSASFDLNSFDKEFQRLREALTDFGEVISTTPGADPSHAGQISFRIKYVADLDAEELSARLTSFACVTIAALWCPDDFEQEVVPGKEKGLSTRSALVASAPVVRVELGELDRLISASHEVFRETVAALEVVSNRLADEHRAELKNLDAQIRQSLISLEEQIIKLRMVPVGRMIQRAIRAGRVAARLAGKEIEFSAAGADLLIDKSLCDAASDPLLHLVRNAVDHGIETPDERVRAGKGRIGRIRLEASAQEGGAGFLIIDDGRGIDVDAVTKAAVKLGLVERDAALSVDQSLRLIFRPGFSTAKDVSSVSGRGVGLDVVESAIEQAGGAVRVRTQPGKGSEFLIQLAATFGVLRSMVIRSGAYRYCIDATQVIDHFQIDAAAIADSLSDGSLRWQDSHLRLTGLAGLLAQPNDCRTESNRVDVLIFQPTKANTNDRTDSFLPIAILVDAVESTQEILVRSLGRHAARWTGIAGASQLRDGNLALVLEIPALLNSNDRGTDFSL